MAEHCADHDRQGEVLHAGRDVTRDKFMAALEAMGKVNYGS